METPGQFWVEINTHKVIVTAVARKLVIIANALCKSRREWEHRHP